MGKKLFIASFFLLILAGIVGGIAYYISLPKNAKEQFELAQKIERENSAQILKLKTSGKTDPAKLDQLDDEIDAAYQKVIDKYPDAPEAEESEFTLIQRARAAGDLKGRELIARFEEFMTKYPESKHNPDIVLRIAKIYDDELNLKGEAIKIYQEFVEKYPDDERAPEALFEVAKIQERLKEFEAAEKTYSEIIDKYPDSELAAEAQYRRGNLRADELDKKKEAMKDFEDVAEKHPESKQAKVAQARRQEVARASVKENSEEKQEEYYGTEEVSYMTAPLQDWNDPTVTVIREQLVDSLSYEVAVALDPKTSHLSADVDYHVQTTTKTLDDQFIMQFNGGLRPDSITMGDDKVSFEQKGNFLHMALPKPMRAGEQYDFRFKYAGTADDSWKGDVIDERGTYLRPESRWYPYTSWGDEFTVDLDIEVPVGLTAIGPGLMTDTTRTSDTVTFTWTQKEPIGILAIVANNYEMKERPFDDGRLVLQAYMYPEHKEFIDLYLDEMESILSYYEELFGDFPYAKMAVAEIPYFPGGYGSPTLLMITDMVFNDKKKVVAEFLAHEITHQWFGNLLGLNLVDDSHPWLSEGFATYIDALYIEHSRGRTPFLARVLSMANLYIESLQAFEPVPMLECLWDNPMYRTLVYEKGGLILHTLRFVMGDDAFFNGLRDYVDRYRHKSVRARDFVAVMEDHYGASLQWWADEWLKGTGFPHYYVAEAKAEEKLVKGGGTESAAADKRVWTTDVTLQIIDEAIFEGPIEVKIEGADDQEHRERVWLDGRERIVSIETPFRPERVVLDPESYLLKYPGIDDLEEDVKIVETE